MTSVNTNPAVEAGPAASQPEASAGPEAAAGRFVDVIGREHVRAWTTAEVGAWTGLIETFESQQRRFAVALERDQGVSVSSAGLLGRLAGADEGRARLSTLACDSGLSLSRVSRIVDSLERRGLVDKRRCPSDARAMNAHITGAGRAAAASAQAFMDGWLREHFFDQLTTSETEALAAVFNRLSQQGDSTPCD